MYLFTIYTVGSVCSNACPPSLLENKLDSLLSYLLLSFKSFQVFWMQALYQRSVLQKCPPSSWLVFSFSMSFFLKIFLFWGNCRFTCSFKKQSREILPALPPFCVQLWSKVTVREWTLIQFTRLTQSDSAFTRFVRAVRVCFVLCNSVPQ